MRYWTAALFLMFPTAGLACSPIGGYRAPTNIELLQKADLVVLARVSRGPLTDAEAWGGSNEPRVTLRPIKVLKGTAPPELRVEGMLSDRNGHPYPFTPTGLDQVHPSALEGACIRERYKKGSMVLAMFRRKGAGYAQLDDPFARSIEDVQGSSSIWPRTAELYLRLLRIPEATARRNAFRAERRQLTVSRAPDARAIAADIDRYLKVTRN